MLLNEVRTYHLDRIESLLELKQNFEVDQHTHGYIQYTHLPAHQSLADYQADNPSF